MRTASRLEAGCLANLIVNMTRQMPAYCENSDHFTPAPAAAGVDHQRRHLRDPAIIWTIGTLIAGVGYCLAPPEQITRPADRGRMGHIRPGISGLVRRAIADGGLDSPDPADALTLPSMAAAATHVHNADAPWKKFSSDDYWRANYHELQAEDQEIIHLVSNFFIRAFADDPPAQRAIDVGSGTNLYPALLMLPWTRQILLTDYSASNVGWLSGQVADDSPAWTWQPFWQELQGAEGYNRISEPRRQLRRACASEPECAGIEQLSVFDLPKERWQLGTMFFVAESITEDPEEFRAAIASFVGALKPGAPFATAFMAGSDGYPVAGTRFPALPITPDHVTRRFTELGAKKLSVEKLQPPPRVRAGYKGMIVATGFVGDR
jgi:NNMT/PNMT/TEMT family